jgi:RNA polymerase sigma-70 factor, ECF subfamily
MTVADTSHVVAAARERWPGIAIAEGPLELAEPAAELPPFAIELVLARACLAGDPAAIRVLHDEMFARVDRVLARLGLHGADADDIKQDVRTKLLVGGDAKLALFQGTGPLAHWIASVAGREALTVLRKRKPTRTLDPLGDEDLLDAADDPQLLALKSRHSADFKEAFQAAVAGLEPRDRAILRALIVDNRSVNEIAAVYGIHRVTASRRISEIRHALLQATRRRLRQRLELDDPSLDSAIRLIDSNLDLSLYRLLADAA